MRLIILCLTALLVLIQYPLWLGKGGWLRVWDLDKQVQQAQKKNDELKARNAKLESEVEDLKQGTGSVEERARYELGMIKQNEVFIQVLDGNPAGSRTPPASPVSSASPVLPSGGAAAGVTAASGSIGAIKPASSSPSSSSSR
ncbi:cell division protein FtsB [Herbaspirillum sp. meg3]|jgi:cell division protein FtsB|uniref:cell division protein FtsB n=1 Tax=Herbaspirillum sp. meg3 TaxID=2025949 RepID=UPI000B99886F|nr:cell division protein FtsB [Herbaspirillum sp. meg3]ASU38472.1 cell division protein FtsB [Herbaspirillum sp. meg3]